MKRIMHYRNRLFAEATMQLLDEGYTAHEAIQQGHETLATMARRPNTIAAVNRARDVAPKDRWATLDTPHGNTVVMTDAERSAANAVWRTLPGYTCLMDAVTIIARL